MRAHALLVFLGLASTSGLARADMAETCVKESYRGQKARDDGQLVMAREALAMCSAASCPSLVVRDCTKWLAEVEERLPTVIVVARDAAGRDVVATRVLVDGKLRQPMLDGRAFPIDPGPHEFRFEAGRSVTTEQILIREREKGRVIEAHLPNAEAVRAPPAAGTGPERTTPSSGGGISPAVWILGGVAIVGFVGFGVLYASGVSKRDDLRATCAGSCATSEVDKVRTLNAFAIVSGAVGLAAALGATGFVVFERRD